MPSPAIETHTPDLILRIGTLDEAAPKSRFVTAPLSIALHLVGLAALTLVPVLTSADLPEPSSGVRAFLVEPPTVAAPPPPPPPAAAAPAARRSAPAPSAAPRFVAPVETPEAVVPEAALDLDVASGEPGGVEGGVEGGVVGGIIGGLPAAPAAPVAPVRVGGKISEPRKVKHVVPEYPEVAVDARIRGVVILEALIGPDGRVQSVTVLRGVPLLQEAAVKAVRQWVYTPTLLDGIPVPVIMTVTVSFNYINHNR